jgi:4'-phosphopantetheinyl transferase
MAVRPSFPSCFFVPFVVNCCFWVDTYSMQGKTLETLRWERVPTAPVVPAGTLHLWKIETPNADTPCSAALQDLLSPVERERMGRLRLALHRRRYLHAQAGLRKILASYLDCRPEKLVFLRGHVGKPYIEDTPLHFNLTTSADLALVGVSLDIPLGIDCEQVAAPEPERHERFYLAWTALEADVKADGRGLFRQPIDPAAAPPEVRHCIPESGFVAAVARAHLPAVAEWRAMVLASTGGAAEDTG